MFKQNLLAALSLLGLVGFAGCGSSDEQSLQDCVKEHMEEKLSETDAITECLSDELHKNFASQADCEAFVTANGGYASKAEACQHYFDEKKPAADAGTGN